MSTFEERVAVRKAEGRGHYAGAGSETAESPVKVATKLVDAMTAVVKVATAEKKLQKTRGGKEPAWASQARLMLSNGDTPTEVCKALGRSMAEMKFYLAPEWCL